jgi:transposase
LTNEFGLPVAFCLTPGQRNDCTQAPDLLAGRKAEAVIADCGYDTGTILDLIQAMDARVVIRPRKDRLVPRPYDRTLYKLRNRIERTFAHLKQLRRFATRYDKLKLNFHATVAIACSALWLKLYVDTP